jgi:hypothetical protein
MFVIKNLNNLKIMFFDHVFSITVWQNSPKLVKTLPTTLILRMVLKYTLQDKKNAKHYSFGNTEIISLTWPI